MRTKESIKFCGASISFLFAVCSDAAERWLRCFAKKRIIVYAKYANAFGNRFSDCSAGVEHGDRRAVLCGQDGGRFGQCCDPIRQASALIADGCPALSLKFRGETLPAQGVATFQQGLLRGDKSERGEISKVVEILCGATSNRLLVKSNAGAILEPCTSAVPVRAGQHDGDVEPTQCTISGGIARRAGDDSIRARFARADFVGRELGWRTEQMQMPVRPIAGVAHDPDQKVPARYKREIRLHENVTWCNHGSTWTKKDYSKKAGRSAQKFPIVCYASISRII